MNQALLNREWWLLVGTRYEFNSDKYRYLRQKRGLTHQEMAQWAEVLPGLLEDIEAGNVKLYKDIEYNLKVARLLVIGVTGKKEI